MGFAKGCWLRVALQSGLVAGLSWTGSLRAAGPSHDAFAVQAARDKLVAQFAGTDYYPPDTFDLSDLPVYVPQAAVSGTLRIWGSDMFGGPGLKAAIEGGFRKYQPGVRFEDNMKGPIMAVVGLLSDQADIGVGRRMQWPELLAFQRIFNHDPLVVRGMTGWAVNPPFAIVVNQSNPVSGLTMAQLDGIFGAQRTGGWVGTTWHPEFARGPEANLRTWGQVGLGGAWADRPIHVLAYALRCMFGPRFSDDVLKGSDKWNETLRQYFNVARPDGTLLSMDQQMADDLAKDPCAIAFFSSLRGRSPGIRPVPIAPVAGGPYYPVSLGTVREHEYPLYDWTYFYINRSPGKPLDPKVREFMRFLLSREAQEAVQRDGKMLPLTAAQIQVELRKLD